MSYHTDRATLEKKYAGELARAEQIIGGYKVSILNHPSRTEKRYTITGTNGDYYATSNKKEFFRQLRGIVWRIQN